MLSYVFLNLSPTLSFYNLDEISMNDLKLIKLTLKLLYFIEPIFSSIDIY